MAAVERIQGLRRPGASLLKKTLPARPSEKALSRKAVPTSSTNSPSIQTETSTSTSEREQGSVATKDLPSPPPPPPPPHVDRPPRGSSLNDQDQKQIPYQQSQSQTPDNRNGRDHYIQVHQTNQVNAVDRASQQNEYSQQNLLLPHAPHNARPVSEAPSISQFIPDPEPEPADEQPGLSNIERNSSSSSSSSSNINNINGESWTPPLPDPVVIPPLKRVHYHCFQGHRHMPSVNNLWYATACMTCRKLDQEVRHCCTFCSLRVCAGCFERLQKSKERSLAEVFGSRI